MAVICSSFTDLGVKNEAFFEKVKASLLNRGPGVIKPIDCAQIMTSFCKLNLHDNELFYLLEKNFYDEIR